MNFVFPPAPIRHLPIIGDDRVFPVHRVYCVGRNYAEHAREFGNDPTDPPFFFLKTPDSLVTGDQVRYPPLTGDLQFEVELVVALENGGVNLPVAEALSRVFGYAVGIDLTRRDLQQKAKDLRRPWDVSKAFEHSAPVGPIAMAEAIGHPDRGLISLDVNGEIKQRGDLSEMMWGVPQLISHLSTFFELQAGDVIFTGTPSGVGPVVRGDRMHAHIDVVGDHAVRVV